MDTKKPRILCVDDEPVNLSLLEDAFVSRGYEVVLSANGREALEHVHTQKIDLVLLDVMIPEINGYDVCKKIKGDERCRNIPVVIITGLTSKEDRIKGIEAGAEDFITKPFDYGEIFSRIKMLLKMKNLNDSLNFAYSKIADLTSFGENMLMSFDPLNFNFISKIDNIVDHIIRKTIDADDRPQMVIVGFVDENSIWQWYLFESCLPHVRRTWLKQDIDHGFSLLSKEDSNGFQVRFYNAGELEGSPLQPFVNKMESLAITVSNIVCVISNAFCIFSLNYNKNVSHYDAEVLNSIAMQSLFLKSLASQVKETEDSFDYLVFALARAAESNDEDTGNHILRVGEYCALIANELGMSEQFVNIIRIQATLHDVGKIHVHPDILKKPGKLTPEEYEEVKKHPLMGARILGDHVRLTLAKKAALSHHERWDGSGYPYGLKGDQIPLEGRILNIADQYDALRNHRVYKPSFDHDTTCRILIKGDGRTMPYQFDPKVLRVFQEIAPQFENIYDRLKN